MNGRPCGASIARVYSIFFAMLLVASAVLGAPPATTAKAAAGFENLGALGLPQVQGGAAWGDYDRDGDLDLALAGGSVYRNEGGETFVPAGSGLGDGASPVWVDYDHDGDLDVIGSSAEGTRLCRNDGGTFVDVGVVLSGERPALGDYDNDGDLDILLLGLEPGSPAGSAATRLCRHDGGDAFVEVETGLAGIAAGAAAWGDHDGDGDLDLVLAGETGVLGSGSYTTRVYRNEGEGVFADTGAALPGMAKPSATWADYDGDGDLDLLLVGEHYDGAEYQPATRLYRNDRAGTLTEAGAGLPDLCRGGGAWGDSDGDGDLDLLLTGSTRADASRPSTRLYHNNGDGTFKDSHHKLPDLENGTAAWGDYDGDGDLDLVLTGTDRDGAPVTEVCRNDGGTRNTPPGPPADLAAALDGALVLLSWGAAGDGETPGPSLTYNLRVGSSPGAMDVVAPMADPGGVRLLPQPGNVGQGTTTWLRLPPGTYYWSVQAVDAGFAGGTFAGEGSFVVLLPPGQVTVEGPASGALDVKYAFTATVAPDGTTLPLTFLWEASGQTAVRHEGVSALVDSATFGWAAPGPQTITVAVSNGGGAVAASHTITLYEAPVAAFEFEPAAGVAPLTVSFSNTSGGVYTSSLWDFGDGVTSTLTSPTHTYTAAGSYAVTLAVDGPLGADVVVRPGLISVSAFTDIGAGLPGVGERGVSWADLDGDGDLDVFDPYEGRIYRNDGVTFTPVSTDLPASMIRIEAVAWGDYDADADLDLLLSGQNRNSYRPSEWPVTRVYRNDGNFHFTDLGAPLTRVAEGCVAWGDYDNDGDLDALVVGARDQSFVENYAGIFRNDAGAFTDVGASLAGVRHASAAWGDYDNDGDLDILLTGDTGWGPVTLIYRNDDGQFTDAGAGLQGVFGSSVAWGDYDGDGDLDIALAGHRGFEDLTLVYRNDGGSFVDIGAGLVGVSGGTVAWGDYDNDGDLDLLLTGIGGQTYLTRLYANTGGAFSDTGASLPGTYNGCAAWGDYDADGDLDILLAGSTPSGNIMRIYRNEGVPANHLPGAPTGLTAAVEGPCVLLGWDAAGDAETPPVALSYNLRVGTTPGGADVVSPMADLASGRRLLPALGNAQQGLTATLRSLRGGVYYWAVQAVDNAWAGSAFSEESSFAVYGDSHVLLRGPLEGTVGLASTFVAIFRTVTATLPVTYTWQADGLDPAVHTDRFSWTDTADLTWGTDGPKWVTVTASNAECSVAAGRVITIHHFTDLDAELEGVAYGESAWGDYDGDGDLDLVVAGSNDTVDAVTRLYRNDGGHFSEAGISLPGVAGASAGWGDYDADGDLDLLVTGYGDVIGERYTHVLRNEGNGAFSRIEAGLPGVGSGCARWGDYDGDGDLDVLLTGYTSDITRTTSIYRNDGNGAFSDIGAGLPGLSYADAAWGDYDADGDLDLALCGVVKPGCATRVYRNEGGNFVDTNAGLAGYDQGTVAWGDYDSDGDLDLLVAGYSDAAPYESTRLYRNDGGAFVEVAAGLPAASWGAAAAWGDYDADGDLDILLSGRGAEPPIAKVLRNDGGTFSEVDAGLQGIQVGSVAWGDYDNDGDLDVLLCGAAYWGRTTRIYRNDGLEANTPPGTPGELTATVSGGAVTLSWGAAADAETPPAGLTYNLRVGTAPGLGDVVSPMADAATGWRRLPALGYPGHALTTTLHLPPGTYYWSVQAVDAAWAGGPFAPEGSSTVP